MDRVEFVLAGAGAVLPRQQELDSVLVAADRARVRLPRSAPVPSPSIAARGSVPSSRFEIASPMPNQVHIQEHIASWGFPFVSAGLCAALFAGMVLVSLACHRLARRRLRDGEGNPGESGPASAAIFALLGLLIAFTFSGAYSRLETRRRLIVEEVNAIGTAYLRLDLLPAETQGPLRQLFRDYAASREAFYPLLANPPAARAELARSTMLQREIWSRAVEASRGVEPQSPRMLLLPALNQMIDITTTRTIAIQTRLPLLILAMLLAVSLLCAGLIGYAAASSGPLRPVLVIGFSAVTALTLYVILEVEMPRHGLIRLDHANQLFAQLAEMMK